MSLTIQGLEILDFPCNQFANQAPGDDNETMIFAPEDMESHSRNFPKLR